MNKIELKIAREVNKIISELEPKDFWEPINWGDLSCYDVIYGERQCHITITEASPDCPYFKEIIEEQIEDMVNDKIKIVVITEW